jgi:hypothetical protein
MQHRKVPSCEWVQRYKFPSCEGIQHSKVPSWEGIKGWVENVWKCKRLDK